VPERFPGARPAIVPWRPLEPLLSRQPGEGPGNARPRGQGAHEASRLLLWTLRCRNDAASARSPPPLRASSSASCRPTRAVGACQHGSAAPRRGAPRATGASTVLTPSRMMRAPNSRPPCAARRRAGYACGSAPAGAPPRHARAPGVAWPRTLPHAATAPEATCSSAKRRKQSSGAPAPWCSKTGTTCPARRVRAAPTVYAQVDAASPKVEAASGLARQAWPGLAPRHVGAGAGPHERVASRWRGRHLSHFGYRGRCADRDRGKRAARPGHDLRGEHRRLSAPKQRWAATGRTRWQPETAPALEPFRFDRGGVGDAPAPRPRPTRPARGGGRRRAPLRHLARRARPPGRPCTRAPAPHAPRSASRARARRRRAARRRGARAGGTAPTNTPSVPAVAPRLV
jgi:hypothetical protein